MKKAVIIPGIIAGIIVSALMAISLILYKDNDHMEIGMVIGYSSMLIAFSLIFVGIKNYRDKQNNGSVSFGKAFLIGLYITLIASTFYVGSWMIESHFFIPDFAEKYSSSVIEATKAKGASPQELALTIKKMDEFKTMYKNPLFVIMMTYLEIIPVGILVSLIAGVILKRRTAN